MPTLLLVDDEPNVLYSLERGLHTDDLVIRTARTARQGVELVRSLRPDALILDVRLPDMSGLEAFEQVRHIDPRLPVIIITAFAGAETAIAAMKHGAFEYLLKPVDLHQLREVVARALELSRLRHVPAVFDGAPTEDAGDVDRIIGQSPAMQAVYKAIGRIAPQDVAVLLVGESGTGKELVARAIYQHSKRADRPFLAINCAAIPEALLESELFGHEKGAFTGADRQRVGKFEQADGGTLFLDEVGDMSPATQAKVLRLLQEQRFEPVGSNRTVQTDVRVIAATNQNLEDMVSAGKFRLDLLYRLNGFTIRLPALRERREDLTPLVEHFIRLGNRDLGRDVHGIAPEALALMEAHAWPGNVRELQSAIRYAIVQSVGDVLTPESLPDYLRTPGGAAPAAATGRFDLLAFIDEQLASGGKDVYRKVSQAVDRVILEAVLRHVKGSQVQASDVLGISRTTLRSKMTALGITLERSVQSEGT